MSVLELIDHPDADARQLLAAAVAALPDRTPLLVLADRLAEVGDSRRERLTRRLEASLRQAVAPIPGVGPVALAALLHYLDRDEATLACSLAILTAPVPPTLSARCSIITGLGMAAEPWDFGSLRNKLRRLDPGTVLDSPTRPILRDEGQMVAQDELRSAARLLLARESPTDVARAIIRAEYRAYGIPFARTQPETAARHRIAGCCSAAADLAPALLLSEARRAEQERRQQARRTRRAMYSA